MCKECSNTIDWKLAIEYVTYVNRRKDPTLLSKQNEDVLDHDSCCHHVGNFGEYR